MPDSITSPLVERRRDRKQPTPVGFEDFAKQRKLLQEFCLAHVQSLEFYLCERLPIFRLDDDESPPTKFRHITSTATCYASIDECPDKFRPDKSSLDFKTLGSDFAAKAIAQPVEEWKSDGAAHVYCSCRGLPFVLSQLVGWHASIDQHLERIFYQMDADPSRFAIGEAERTANQENALKEQDSWYPPNAYHTYWTLELLRILQLPKFEEGRLKSKKISKALGRIPLLRHWARQQLLFQVALAFGNLVWPTLAV